MKYVIHGVAVIALLVSGTISFVVYGELRIFSANVNFDLPSTLRACAGAVVAAAFIVAGLFLVSGRHRLQRWMMIMYGGVLVSALFGSTVAEAVLLYDEFEFALEVVDRLTHSENEGFGRPRISPFDGASLVYRPQTGVHATD